MDNVIKQLVYYNFRNELVKSRKFGNIVSTSEHVHKLKYENNLKLLYKILFIIMFIDIALFIHVITLSIVQ